MFKFSVICGLLVALVAADVAGTYLTNIADAYRAALVEVQNR